MRFYLYYAMLNVMSVAFNNTPVNDVLLALIICLLWTLPVLEEAEICPRAFSGDRHDRCSQADTADRGAGIVHGTCGC